MSGLLLRSGMLVDGTGAPARRADVRTRGEVVVDADGAIVSPGFIDVHTHLDPSLFWDPSADPMPGHGVTTVLTGNCSLSLAPVRPGDREGIIRLFSYIEDLPETTLRSCLPWNWELWSEYLQAAPAAAVNSAGLVGHTPLRVYVMGEAAWERPATDAERVALAAALDDCLVAGAYGLSTSMFDEDPDGRPVPSRLADDAELQALVDVVATHRAQVQFVPSFLHDPSASIRRISTACAGRPVTATWTGLIHDPALDQMMGGMLRMTEALVADGQRMVAQVSPRSVDARISWDRSMVFMALRESWHRVVGTEPSVRRSLLADPQWRAVARQEWDQTQVVKFPTRKLDKAKLVSVGRPELAQWIGRSLGDLVAARGGHPSDVLADWLLDNDLDAGVVLVGLHNDDPEGVAGLLASPATLVGGSDAGAHIAMVCTAGDTTLLLARHVRDRQDLSLETAVAELTGRAAALVGLADRGVVAPGAKADLTVFDLDQLELLPEQLVDDIPGGGLRFRRDARGYRATIVNGVLTQQAGQPTGARPGGALRRSAAVARR